MYDRQVKGGKSSYTHDKSAVAFTEENIFPLTLVCSALSPFFLPSTLKFYLLRKAASVHATIAG